MKAIRLKTEHLFSPVGVDFKKPRLFWNCEDGILQTAYQIVASDDDENILLDTGKVLSSSMFYKWDGADIPSKTKVIWKVRLWDENDTIGEYSETFFETGIDTFKANWITGNYKVNRKKRYPVDCFRKTFNTNDIKKARLYISACGLYSCNINDLKVGDFCLAPGITDYKKRIQYQTYDVTNLLKDGENNISIELADGWYRGSCGAWGLKNQYGSETKLLAELHIYKNDGTVDIIISDDSWNYSNDGPFRFADIQDGEIVDANMIPSYREKAKLTKHNVIPSASNNVYVKEHETLDAVLIKTPTNKKVLDFKQNIAGYISFKINAKRGQVIKFRFGEMLDENGEFTQKNIQCSSSKLTTPLQEIIYTCKEGINEYKTKFAFFGFEYVLLETDVDINPNDFKAIAVYSDMERTIDFNSSNILLNKFVENTIWSTKNNHLDLPTDCPTRERHGWTGDAQIFCSTASYLFDYYPIAKKYLNDVYDWQKKNGCLPQVAPSGGVDFYMTFMNGSVGWADVGVIMPYVLYKQYNDIEILRKYYVGMEKYAKFMINRCGMWGGPYAKRVPIKKYKKYLCNCGQSYDEWAEPQDVYVMNFMDFAGPHPEVSTAYTAFIMDLMIEISDILDEKENINLYKEYSKGCRNAYREMIKLNKFSIDTDRQAKLVRPLAFNLLDEKDIEFAKKRLIKALDNYKWRLGTGFLSTPLILDELTKIDVKYAYKLLENEEMPGWLFMPKNGATTIWESWEGQKAKGSGVGSLNHYSKGAMCRWLFDTMCGIKVDSENHFIIKPLIGGHFTYASTSYNSIYGMVKSSWKIENKKIIYEITVPSNCDATIVLDNKTYRQEAGLQIYEMELYD